MKIYFVLQNFCWRERGPVVAIFISLRLQSLIYEQNELLPAHWLRCVWKCGLWSALCTIQFHLSCSIWLSNQFCEMEKWLRSTLSYTVHCEIGFEHKTIAVDLSNIAAIPESWILTSEKVTFSKLFVSFTFQISSYYARDSRTTLWAIYAGKCQT